jgi:hypothetical protein
MQREISALIDLYALDLREATINDFTAAMEYWRDRAPGRPQS